MLILDDLYASPEVLDFLEASHEPVLDNAAARAYIAQGRNLTLANESEAAHPQRVIALSEMNLNDAKRFCFPEVSRAIDLCKDKAALRRTLAPLYPDYYYRELAADELDDVDASSLPYPLVLKPATGFFSLGVYPLSCPDDWHAACADIRRHSTAWARQFSASVVNDARFILEGRIDGQEYALEAYFDHEGKAVVLDILKHDFAGDEDTSDRLYYTSKRIIEEQLEPMTAFLDRCNELLGFRDFPVHPEVRITADGTIIPVEFNPCRFAGLCGTDLAYFAWGFKTYDYFLRDARPNWSKVLEGKDGLAYPMVVLTYQGDAADSRFNYDALRQRFSRVLSLRPHDIKRLGSFGFVFLEVPLDRWDEEMSSLLNSDLEEFVL